MSDNDNRFVRLIAADGGIFCFLASHIRALTTEWYENGCRYVTRLWLFDPQSNKMFSYLVREHPDEILDLVGADVIRSSKNERPTRTAVSSIQCMDSSGLLRNKFDLISFSFSEERTANFLNV